MRFSITPILKKIALALLFTEVLSLSAFANPGDTTWVTVFNAKKLTHYGDYDTTTLFPTGKRYRKIRMHYILGRYACAASDQYCGSWDYTTQIFSLPKNKDTVEVARVITPYATDWLQKNLSHDYIIDVTDYATVLDDSTHLRYHYDGYSWGFTITLKLEMIEGVPPMDAQSVKNIYRGYFAFGKTADPIENHLIPKALLYQTPKAFIKNTVSGHGSDNVAGCSEFCSKYYQLFLNSNMLSQTQLWRSDCGMNEVYPQTGTWIFERGNWCPGAIVKPIYHDIGQMVSSNTTFTANIDMEPYTASNNFGGYNFQTQLISYSNFNNSIDAEISDIIAPSSDLNYIRENNTCKNPTIKVRNSGANPLNEIQFEYGPKGQPSLTYTWTGTLNPLEETVIVFPPSTCIMSQSVAIPFEVRILNVNGGITDDYAANDYYYSKTNTVTVYPKDLVINMNCNGSTSSISGFNETSWTLYNESDSIVAQRVNANNYTLYQDTVKDLPQGCYKFVISDDGCDGFQWWYYQYYNPNPGNGNLRFDAIGGSAPLIMFPGDIGCGYTKYFYVGTKPALCPPPNPVFVGRVLDQNSLQLSPNPTSDELNLFVSLNSSAAFNLQVRDVQGRLLSEKQLGRKSVHAEKIQTSNFEPGIYFVDLRAENGDHICKKFVVTR